ncbi:MAG TPA: SigE family RNA polymerase sigma factor [Pilimelia sp.]|nr:SigE family RNA polymerase sigma factor [Pilimelia sp.]
MKPADEERFREFVNGRSAALLRSAYLLVGDRGRAEDLVQTALIKTYASWPRIRDLGALEAYVRRAMVTTATSWWRRRRLREHPVGDALPTAVADGLEAVAERDAMWRQLAALPVKQRAVLVLRYYEGLSEAEIAEVLAVSRGTVKSHASRALAALRTRLSETLGVAA